MDRWAEYKAGTLPANSVVQHDTLYAGTPKEEHFIWFWNGEHIFGPISRKTFDAGVEAEIAATVAALVLGSQPDTFTITCEDGAVLTGILNRLNPGVAPTEYTIDLTIDPTPQQAAAWNLIKPVLAAHLRKVNRVYKAATPDYRERLRSHCPIFDAVYGLVEDEG